MHKLHAQKKYLDDYLSTDVRVNDFIKRNIQAGTTPKNFEFEQQRVAINRVHASILARKDYMLDVAGL